MLTQVLVERDEVNPVKRSVRGCKKYCAGRANITGGGAGGVNPTLGCNGISEYHKVTIANPQQFRYILLEPRQNITPSQESYY